MKSDQVYSTVWISILLFLLSFSHLSCTGSLQTVRLKAEDTGPTLIRTVQGIHEYQLPNNLTVLIKEDHTAPVFSLMVTYRVGSKNDPEGERGASHLLEHMMFKGTPSYQKALNTSIPNMLQSVGAIMNAGTWADRTSYYETLPAVYLPLALDIEAERMRNALLTPEDLNSEAQVVQSEIDRMENAPLAALDLAVRKEAFRHHPYRYPIIGKREDIRNISSEELRNFYNTYYWPNNAVLSIVGDVDVSEAIRQVNEYFGAIPASLDPVPSLAVDEPEQSSPHRVEITRPDDLEAVLIAHKSSPRLNDDAAALDVIAHVLGTGKTSRLYRRLIDGRLASSVATDVSTRKDAEFFTTEIVLLNGVKHQVVEQEVLSEYEAIRQNGISPEELDRAKKYILSTIALSKDGTDVMSSLLGLAVGAGDWTYIADYPAQIQNLTNKDILRVAQLYLTNNRMTVGYLIQSNEPEKNNQPKTAVATVSDGGMHEESFGGMSEREAGPETRRPAEAVNLANEGSQWLDSLEILANEIDVQNVDGIQVMVLQTSVQNVVTVAGSFGRVGLAYDPNPFVPALTLEMLDQGTQHHDKFEIARQLEERGTSIQFSLDDRRVRFQARCQSEDLPLILRLIAEQLRVPLFNKEEFEKLKERKASEIRQAMSSTFVQAQDALLREIYPEPHPHYAIPLKTQLELLKKTMLEDIVKFHESRYGANNLILAAVGDFSPTVFKNSIQENFSEWKSAVERTSIPGNVLLADEPDFVPINIPSKVNIDVFLGHAVPLKRTDPPYLPLKLGTIILGGNFSARLSEIIRDQLGLTYTVFASLQGIDDETEGHFQVYLNLNQDSLDEGLERTKQVISDFVRDGVTEEEVQTKKSTWLGQYLVSLSSTAGLASRILSNAELGFAPEYLYRIVTEIAGIEVEDVNQSVQAYVHPNVLHVSIAGALPEAYQREEAA